MSLQNPTPDGRKRQLREYAEQGKHQLFDALWAELTESSPEDVGVFMQGIAGLESIGNFEKAGQLLSGLTARFLEQGQFENALVSLRKMAEIAPKERILRHGLLTAYKAIHKDNPHLPIFLRHSKIEADPDLKTAVNKMDTYFAFREGRYVHHPAGWGTGRIVMVDAEQASVVIDFGTKKGHRLSMEMARNITEFVDSNDLRAMKLDRLAELTLMVEGDTTELIRAALRSRRNKATLRELRDRLTDGIIPAGDWSRWWQKARLKLKTASDVTVAPGSNPIIELAPEMRGYSQNCLRDLRLLDNDVKRVKYFRDLLKEAQDHSDGEEAVTAVAQVLMAGLSPKSDVPLGCRISLAFLMKEAQQIYKSITIPPEAAPQLLCSNHKSVMEALPSIPIAGHRIEALEVLRESGDKDWAELYRTVILRGEPETADAALSALVRHGRKDVVDRIEKDVIGKFRDFPLAFTFFARHQLQEKLPEGVPQIPLPTLLEKIVILHSHLEQKLYREEDAELRKVGKTLANLIQAGNYSVVKDAFVAATETEGRNVSTVIRSNRSLPRDIRDKMIAYMLRTRPELARQDEEASALPGGVDANVIYTTEQGLFRKQQEYEHLVNVDIPENAAEIGRAASYGDLSENAEWSAAIEKQTQLTRKSEDLARDLNRARVIEHTMQDGEHVTVGSKVTLSQEGTNRRQIYTLLGPWDADQEKGILSYLSPLGMAILGRRVGEDVPVPLPSGIANYKVELIVDGLAEFGT